MGLFRKPEKFVPTDPASDAGGFDKRQTTRYPTAVISCMLGPVADLSARGMRIIAPKAPPLSPGDLVRLELQSPKDELVVVGKVVRLRKCKPAGFDIGIEFQDLTPELTACLESLGRNGFIKGRRPPAAAPVMATARMPDLYAMLGIAPDSTPESIHAAYRELARQIHPDLNPSPEAQDRFIQLHKAYDVLKDPEKRSGYDAALRARAA